MFFFSFFVLFFLEFCASKRCTYTKDFFAFSIIINNYFSFFSFVTLLFWGICVFKPLARAQPPDSNFHLKAPALNFYFSVLHFAVKVCYSQPRFQCVFLQFLQNCSGDEVVSVSTYINSAFNYMYLLFKYNVGNK